MMSNPAFSKGHDQNITVGANETERQAKKALHGFNILKGTLSTAVSKPAEAESTASP